MQRERSSRRMATVFDLRAYRQESKYFFFDRNDLSRLLTLYSRRVTMGEWKDYAMGTDDGMAMFSVFRRASDRPAYTVIKVAAGDAGKPEYMIYNGSRRLRRGASLNAVLDLFEPRLKLV